METSPTEMKFGPLTIFFEEKPTLPSIADQAATVAKLYEMIYKVNLYGETADEKTLENFARLAEGDLAARYRQKSPQEVDEEKSRLTFEINGEIHKVYDERIVNMALLPLERQLEEDFYTARLHLWMTDNSERITWQEWDGHRNISKIKQASLSTVLSNPRTDLCAHEYVDRLLSLAIDVPENNSTNSRNLRDFISRDMFLGDRIAYPVHQSEPIRLPKRVPEWVWQDGLKHFVPGWWLIQAQEAERASANPSEPHIHLEVIAPEIGYPAHLQRMMSAAPYLVIDRASRDGRNWIYNPTEEVFPYFEDGRTAGIRLTYGTPEAPNFDIQVAAQLAVEQVNRLDDRTADVWRVILWKATENGISSAGVYARIIIDTREIAQFLGYKKHHKGGMKPEHLLEVHNALQHLECMRIYLTPEARGTLEVDTGQAKGKRKTKQLVRAREERVISVMARDGERNLFGQECHMVWELALGDWARFFDRSYAPMFKSLVELPSKSGTHKWAKRIGTELVMHYRQDARGGKVKRLKWSTILERSGLMSELEELRQSRNQARATKYAEGAMDALKEIGVVGDWAIDLRDHKQLNDRMGKPGSLDAWLESVVEITVPKDVVSVLGSIAPLKMSKKTKRTPPSN